MIFASMRTCAGVRGEQTSRVCRGICACVAMSKCSVRWHSKLDRGTCWSPVVVAGASCTLAGKRTPCGGAIGLWQRKKQPVDCATGCFSLGGCGHDLFGFSSRPGHWPCKGGKAHDCARCCSAGKAWCDVATLFAAMSCVGRRADQVEVWMSGL